MDMFDSANTVFDLEAAMLDHQDGTSQYASQDVAISGTALRHRLITPEALAAIGTEAPKPTLLQRLLHR